MMRLYAFAIHHVFRVIQRLLTVWLVKDVT